MTRRTTSETDAAPRVARCVHCGRGLPVGDRHDGDRLECPHCGTEIELHRVRRPRRRRRGSLVDRIASAAAVARVPSDALERTTRRVVLVGIAVVLVVLAVANYDRIAAFVDARIADARTEAKRAK